MKFQFSPSLKYFFKNGVSGKIASKKYVLIAVISSIFQCEIMAQISPNAGLTITPLSKREISKDLNKRFLLARRGISDTLTLPFFEDFSQQIGYPTPTHFTDNQVWVNYSFGIKPPTYGVATFDHLNSHGRPYSSLNQKVSVFADSLTSQPINLQYYWSGSNTINYKTTDSIYLSFFVQAQGLGDNPDTEDTLMLFFKDKNQKYQRVWALGGRKLDQFTEYFVAVDRYDFFNPDFQFRFVNYTKSTGNLNHWHLDYIRLDKNRKAYEKTIEDVAIANATLYPVLDYRNVPYTHYKAHKSSIKGKGFLLNINNLNYSNIVQTRIGFSVKNQYNQILFSMPPAMNVRNIAANRDSTEKIDAVYIDTLSGDAPKLKFDFEIQPQGNDGTPTQYNSKTNNNKISVEHSFMPWYAYDDGSAEGGFGLDYENLGNIKGQFAMDFDILNDDSLRGLAIYFNQSLTDVSSRPFKLKIWKSLSPIGAPDNQDKLIYEYTVDRPIYTDSINNFSYIFFDSVLFLPKGKYYAGWQQSVPFILNVGYDNNYRFNYSDQANPHLFYNLLGSWEHSDPNIMGTPMIRMLFGKRINYAFNTVRLEQFKIKTFPNPSTDWISVQGWTPPNCKYEIIDQRGMKVQEGALIEKINTEKLASGSYQLIISAKDGSIGISKFIKL